MEQRIYNKCLGVGDVWYERRRLTDEAHFRLFQEDAMGSSPDVHRVRRCHDDTLPVRAPLFITLRADGVLRGGVSVGFTASDALSSSDLAGEEGEGGSSSSSSSVFPGSSSRLASHLFVPVAWEHGLADNGHWVCSTEGGEGDPLVTQAVVGNILKVVLTRDAARERAEASHVATLLVSRAFHARGLPEVLYRRLSGPE